MDFVLKSTLGDKSETKKLFLRPDATKKSVFWLDLTTDSSATDANADTKGETQKEQEFSVPSPVEGIITRRLNNEEGSVSGTTSYAVEEQVFAWGGMQITSNAKSIEINYTTPTSPPKENYLTTIKGIPAEADTNFYKALCAVPGGPRGVVAVRLKFLSLQPKQPITSFRLKALRWTARVAPSSSGAATARTKTVMSGAQVPSSAMPLTDGLPSMAAALMGSLEGQNHNHGHQIPQLFAPQHQQPSSNFFTQQQQQIPTSPQSDTRAASLTKEDVGAAMAGMSFSLRATEERVTKQLQKMADTQQHQWKFMSQQLAQQGQLIQYQNAMLQKQQEVLVEQVNSIKVLQEQLNESMGKLLSSGSANRPTHHERENTNNTKQGDPGVPNKTTTNWLQYASMKDP